MCYTLVIEIKREHKMPTLNPRINVTFEPELNEQLNALAVLEHKSSSKLVKELVIEALEKREDIYLSDVADKRDKKGAKKISHTDAWK